MPSFRSFPLNPITTAKYVWRSLHGRARRFIGHNPAGSLIIYAMLFAGLSTVGSGLLVYNDGWLIDQPDLLQEIHFYSSWGWLALVVIHVVGVITESIWHDDNLIKAMITGCKRQSKRSEKSYLIK